MQHSLLDRPDPKATTIRDKSLDTLAQLLENSNSKSPLPPYNVGSVKKMPLCQRTDNIVAGGGGILARLVIPGLSLLGT